MREQRARAATRALRCAARPAIAGKGELAAVAVLTRSAVRLAVPRFLGAQPEAAVKQEQLLAASSTAPFVRQTNLAPACRTS